MAKRICSVEGCDKKHAARGWCDTHYRNAKKYGGDPVGRATAKPKRACAVPECGKPHVGCGYCAAHHRRFKLYGDPLGRAEKQPRKPLRACAVLGCESLTGAKGTARGLCSKHYNRWSRWGDPLALKPTVVPPETCTAPGCEKPYSTAGYCSAHHSNLLRRGEVNPRKRGEVRDGCRVCAHCNLDLPVAEFGRYKNGRVRSHCRDCEKVVAERKRRRNPATFRRYAREYSKRNAEKRRDYQRLRRAMILSPASAFEPVNTAVVLERDGWRCGICENAIPKSRQWPDKLSASLDHIIPLALGGDHTYANMTAAHLGCNMAKGSRVAG